MAPVHGEVATIAEPLGAYRLHDTNMWASDGSDWLRLPARIQHRRQEEARLREHAAARGVALPEQSILDHELAFLSYRLMARKLGLGYEGQERDTTPALAWRTLGVLQRERLPASVSLAHLAWLCALAPAPASVARALIQLRFRRHQLGGVLAARVRRALAARLSAVLPRRAAEGT